jgi:hypothetical protein
MESENEKVKVVLPEGTNYAEVTLREGAAVALLPPKAPVKTDLSGVIGTPFEYLKKRIKTGQIRQENAHLLVNREKAELSLIINENDEYTRGVTTGKLEYHPKFVEFGINSDKEWTPVELGMFFKMNRNFFSDNTVNMKLVTGLMNFTAEVNSTLEKTVKENGERTDNFTQVINSNLPRSFVLTVPIFKGRCNEILEVETFAQINGREVSFILISPGAKQTFEAIRDSVIDAELKNIAEIAPDIAIIEV